LKVGFSRNSFLTGALHGVIARYEAIPYVQSRFYGRPVKFAIASNLAMTGGSRE